MTSGETEPQHEHVDDVLLATNPLDPWRWQAPGALLTASLPAP